MTILFNIGKGKKAAPYIKQWLRTDEGNAAAHYAMGFCLFTYCHDFEHAAEYFSEAVKLAPGDTSYRLSYVNALQCSRRHDEAIEQAALLEGSGLRLRSSRASRLPAYR
jgi:tetratricopeptide (TPR) repeat protein